MKRSIVESSPHQEQHTNPTQALGDLAERARQFLVGLSAPRIDYFLEAWPSSAAATARPAAGAAASRLPALDHLHLPHAAHTHGPRADVIAALQGASPWLAWRQSYTTLEVGAEFLRNYAWTEILGPGAPFASQQIACGFLLLGPHIVYPVHRHEAEEIYVPLSGCARWRQGDALWREHPPGAVIQHLSEEPHAMQTGAQPLLALYLWRSDDLRQKARLDPPSTSEPSPYAPHL